MDRECCKIIKLLLSGIFLITGIGLIISLMNFKRCNCAGKTANKIFDDMGELIGELNFFNKR